MSKSSHTPEAPFTQNQNNAMSDDPGDGSRNAFTPGNEGSTRVEKAPAHDAQDEETIQAFGEREQGA